MIVVANGGYRTGSTFVYKAIIEIASQNGIDIKTGVIPHDEILKIPDYENWVIKSHNWLPPIESKIKTIYTRRNFLDVYSSLVKVAPYSNMNIQDYMKEILEEKRRRMYMLNADCLTIEYDDIYDNEAWAIEKISRYINLICDSNSIAEQLKRSKIKEKTDKLEKGSPDSWTKKHISDSSYPGNFIETLPYVKIQEIISRYHSG